jgi:2-polyprenyl-6-methoxyphenol hydroxylase-like FAD-dependent oxidoreductase
MSSADSRYHVAIVGASIAGCSAALFFARAGLKVALIERSPDLNAYKKVCTHYIQSSATPTIERLGLAEPIERAGGIRNGFVGWTRWGWIRAPKPAPYGYNIRRQVLDPLLRNLAANTPGVTFLPGHSARELLRANGRVTGVRLEAAGGRMADVHSVLTVGADGRNSRIGQLSGLPCKVSPNQRFAYFAHFRDLPLAAGTTSQMWFMEPDVAYTFPNDDGVTLLACMPWKDRLPEFKQDLEGAFFRYFRGLPDFPDLSAARQTTPIMGLLDAPNSFRPAAAPGLAFIGDAALTSDPLWGVGCGWAFQSAEWLAGHTAPALRDGDPARVDRALESYRKAHRSALRGHDFVICDFARRRDYNLIERIFFPASVHDPQTASHFEAFGSRRIGMARFLHPAAVLRALRVNWKHKTPAPRPDFRNPSGPAPVPNKDFENVTAEGTA